MPSIKSLEMAGAVSSHKNITIKKSLFFTKATYTPTQSGIKAMIKEYSPTEGDRLERLLNMPIDKMRDEIQRKGKPIEGAVGNYRLEACLSAALSPNRFSTKVQRLTGLHNCFKL